MKTEPNKMNKFLALLLSFLMVFTMLPTMAFADTSADDGLNTITVNVAPSTADVTFYEGQNAETKLSTDAVTDNGIVGKYHQYILKVKDGMYSYRAVEGEQTLGGMAFEAPVDEEYMSDGTLSGKGQTMTLARANYYTTNKAITAIGDYTLKVMGGTLPTAVNGDQYIDGSSRVVTPVMVTARGNAMTYQILAVINGELAEQYTSPIQTNVIFSDTTSSTMNKTFTVSTIVKDTITAPKGAKVQMFNQLKNFNVEEIPTKSSVENGDGTVTYTFATPGGSNLTYRVSMEGKITRAGYMSRNAEDLVITFDENEDPSTQVNQMDNANIQRRIESSTLVNINAQNNLKLATGDTFRLRAYRGAWQIINSDTANIMIEPDFHYEIISGGEHIEMTPATNRCTGNAGTGDASNWMDIKGVSAGTAIIEVSYDAIRIGGEGTTYDGLYGATDPIRKSLVVINVGETENTLSLTADGASHTWDTEFDTLYYTGETGDFTFTALMGDAAPEKAELSTDNGKTWTAVESADGKFTAKGLVGGNNLLKFTKGDSVEYQVVRAAKVTYTITNKDGYEDAVIEGNTMSIKVKGMYTPLSKFSGIYNPGFAAPNHNIVFDLPENVTATTKGGQYDFINNHSYEVTIDTYGEVTLTNGHIYHSNMGNAPGDHRKLTDDGVGTNFNASNGNYERSVLPEVTFNVIQMPIIPVTVEASEEGAEIVVKNEEGTVLTPENGVYQLEYGTYGYEVTKDGFVPERGNFTVGTKDVEKKTVSIKLRKIEGAIWDGSTKTEPEVDENGVYQIGTGAELAWFAENANDTSYHAVLTDDISLGGFQWTPIASKSSWKGTFDGQGHYVTDLHIDSTSNNVALFGYVSGGAIIKNLGVKGEVKTTGRYAAGIVTAKAASVQFTVENCKSEVNVTAERYAAGIIAQQSTKQMIYNCYNTGNIEATRAYAGGISATSSTSQKVVIENSYNTGKVKLDSSSAGSIVTLSSATYGVNVKNCYGLAGVCNTETKVGTDVTKAELKALAPTLGDAYLANPTNYNNGYPILVWEEGRALPYAQEDAIAVIENYKNAADYREAEAAALADIIETAKNAIAEVEKLAAIQPIVDAAKADMDALKTDAQLAAEELAAAKEAAKVELEAYKDAADYREAEAAELTDIIEEASGAIEAAETIEAIQPIVDAAKADMDALKTDAEYTAEELAAAKEAAEIALNSYDYNDYRLEEKVKLLILVMEAEDAVEKAKSVDEVNTILANAIEAIDELKTDAEYTAEELAAAKEAAKAELEAYKDAADYREAEAAALAEIIKEASAEVEEAGVIEAIQPIVDAAKADMDALKTDAEYTAEELAAAKEAAKAELEAYKDAADYREAEAATMADIIEEASAAIEAAETIETIQPIVDAAKADMDALKTDAEYTAEELAAAKEAAKAELETYKDAADYREAEATTMADIIEEASAAIEAAETIETIQPIVDAAKADMDALKTDAEYTAEELAAAKEAAKAELEAYKDAADYREAEAAELADIIEEALAAIEEAETIEEIQPIVDAAKADMDALKTDAEYTAEELEAETDDETLNESEEPEGSEDTEETPATGDETNVFIYLATMMMAAMAAFGVRRKN